MKADLFWVPGPWLGRLAIAARPRGGDWLDDEMSSWRQSGVDVVVSLLEDEEASQLDLGDERGATLANRMTFISFPIPDRGVPASMQDTASLVGKIAIALDAGKNVALHCRQGIGRSGLIAAGVLMTSATSPQQAIQLVSAARGIATPETAEQRRWIQELPAALPVAKS